MNIKTIKVDEGLWLRLSDIKLKKRMKTMSDVIVMMVKVYDDWNTNVKGSPRK